MKTAGVLSVVVATWQATAGNFQTMFGTMPESVGMVLWGVSLLTLAGAVRHRSAKGVRQRHEAPVAKAARSARPRAGMLETVTARLMGRHSSDSECAVVR